jgi:thymidylate synthase (FAD)
MSKMKVELIDRMGSDLSVVNAARVSFEKESREFSQRDEKLLGYLATHGHWTPFAHAFVSFRIKAPIFVARQLGKHQVGLVWNEVSRRYVDSEPEFYDPGVWRGRADNVKQGSAEEAALWQPVAAYKTLCFVALETYNDMLNGGVCPEMARMVLPQSMMTEWIWSGSVFAFARVCKLRLDPHSQKETQFIAQEISDACRTFFPSSWSALNVA